MRINQQISTVSRIVIALKPKNGAGSASRNKLWFSLMAVCFSIGLMLGITSLVVSMLAALAALGNTRSLSLGVTSMIVGSLGLLLLGAHAMDRMDEGSRDGGDDKSGS